MSTFSPHRALTATAAAVALLATFDAGSASAADRTGQDLINRTDGSRLALYGDSTAEGATAVSLRDRGGSTRPRSGTRSAAGGRTAATR